MVKKKILFIQPTFDTHGPRNIRTENIVRYLNKSYDVHILCFKSYAPFKTIDNVHIHRLEYNFLSKYILNKGQSGYSPRGLVRLASRGLSYILQQFIFPDVWLIERKRISKFLNTNFKFSFDTVICSIVPFSSGIMGIEYKGSSNNNVKLIFDIGDPLSNNAVTKFNNRKIDAERTLLNASNHVIVTNELTKQYYNKTLGIDNVKISIIPQGVNIDLFSMPNDLQQNKVPLFIYAGAFYEGLRDPKAFFNTILDNDNEYNVKVFGSNNSFGIKEDKIKFFKKIPPTELVLEYKKSDVLLFFDNAFGIQTSGKIYELLALKKPILFIYDNPNSLVLLKARKYQNVIVSLNNENCIKKAIKEVISIIGHHFSYELDSLSWRDRAASFKAIINSI